MDVCRKCVQSRKKESIIKTESNLLKTFCGAKGQEKEEERERERYVIDTDSDTHPL